MTSSRRPDNWIVPGGGVEPNEEPACTAVREVLEEAGVIGTLGRCLGMFEVCIENTRLRTHQQRSQPIFFFWFFVIALNLISIRQNYEHKHRTKVYVMHVTEELADWEDSRNMDRKREWFSIDDALQQLALHKPVQRRYLQQLKNSKSLTTPTGAATIQETNSVEMTNNTATPANLLATSTPSQPPASTMQQMQSTTN